MKSMEFRVGDRVVTNHSSPRLLRGVVTGLASDGETEVRIDGGGMCYTLVSALRHEQDFRRDLLDDARSVINQVRNGHATTAPPPERSAVLADADRLINGQRQTDYGPPSVNFQRIATMWSVLFPERKWTPGDVARAMAALKLARTAQGFTRDTAVDGCGYFALYGELDGEK